MNELVTYSLEDNDLRFIGEMPRELLFDEEREMFAGIMNYYRRHGKCPSKKWVAEEYEIFFPFIFTPSLMEMERPPTSEVYDREVKERLAHLSDKMLRAALSEVNDSGKVPLDVLNNIKRLHTLSMGVHRYSTLDRSGYFRRHGVDIPFKILNGAMGGMSLGDYLMFIGRLGTGKSTLIQHLSKAFWEQGKKVLFISAEMAPLDVFSRIDAMVGKFNPLSLREGRTKSIDDTLARVTAKAAEAEGEIIIPKERLLSPNQIAAFAENLQIDLIFIDGVYLLRPDGGGYRSNWESVKAVSNDIQQMALDLEVPVVGTAQIKRGAGGRETYDPEDIAYSDAIGQDAAFLIAIKQFGVIDGRFELQLIKNRYGPTISTLVDIDYPTMQVIDLGTEPAKTVSLADI